MGVFTHKQGERWPFKLMAIGDVCISEARWAPQVAHSTGKRRGWRFTTQAVINEATGAPATRVERLANRAPAPGWARCGGRPQTAWPYRDLQVGERWVFTDPAMVGRVRASVHRTNQRGGAKYAVRMLKGAEAGGMAVVRTE